MNDRRYTYYFLYKREGGEIYAITPYEKDMKKFMEIRNKKYFIQEEYILSRDDLFTMHDLHSIRFIEAYNFYIDHIMFPCYLTKEEIMIIESQLSYYKTVMPAYATITPNIFNKKIFGALATIGYIEMWTKWIYGPTEEDDEDNLLFHFFLNNCGDTLDYAHLYKKLDKL